MKAVSLFANIGVAEALLSKIGIHVVVANELIERRANLYKKIYTDSKMITGDINSKYVFEAVENAMLEQGVDILMATPPCQGVSTAGVQDKDDSRNELILPVIELIKRTKPKFIFIENVPNWINASILFQNKKMLIPDIINNALSNDYIINFYKIDTKDYGVPQMRERVIFLLSRKDARVEWMLPEKDPKVVTMREAIGHLPVLDPYIKDIPKEELYGLFPEYEQRKQAALMISRWHNPPHHIFRQVEAMMYTPTGSTAFDNPIYYPKKANGEPVRGYRNTYKRQNWDTPAYTVTMDNRKISSQNNVHPGRLITIGKNGDPIYSDPRALTVYELMIISSLPSDWKIPSTTSEAFLRAVIGEGIPPLFVNKVFQNLLR